MHYTTYVEHLVDLLDPAANVLLNATPDELAAAVASGVTTMCDCGSWNPAPGFEHGCHIPQAF